MVPDMMDFEGQSVLVTDERLNERGSGTEDTAEGRKDGALQLVQRSTTRRRVGTYSNNDQHLHKGPYRGDAFSVACNGAAIQGSTCTCTNGIQP